MSYTASYFHIVFGTYKRERVLNPVIKDRMLQYIGGVTRKYKSKLLYANYMSDHVHLLIDLSVEVPLSRLVAVIKQSSSLWLKDQPECPLFCKWAKEYYGISLSPTHKEAVKNYILTQEAHHSKFTFDEELNSLIMKAGLKRYPGSFYE